MRNAIFLLATALAASSALGAHIAPSREALRSSARLIEYETSRDEGALLYLKSAVGSETLLEKASAPESVRSVRRRIPALRGNAKTLRTHATKQGTFFGFAGAGGQLHFFSTRGGYLSITPAKAAKLADAAAATQVEQWLKRLEIRGGRP